MRSDRPYFSCDSFCYVHPYRNCHLQRHPPSAFPLDLTTNQMIVFSTLTTESNHSPNINKHLPAPIKKGISNNSFAEKIFKEAAIYYEDILNKAGYINKLVYHTPSASNQENKQKSPLYGLTQHKVKVSQRK